MTTLVISILRIGGIAVGAIGVIVFLLSLGIISMMMGYSDKSQGIILLLSCMYPIITGAALYGFGEVVSLLKQIRDR